jgi:DNA-binding MurR/RpiR family transcriptional regulator
MLHGAREAMHRPGGEGAMTGSDPRAVGPRIRMMMPRMTRSERRIAEWLLMGDVDDTLPLKKVAEETDASEALVVKVAKKLGFEGFRELRAALAGYKRQPVVDLHREVLPDDDAEAILQKVFGTATQALQETLSILDVEAFGRAADLIDTSRQRDFYGLGGSAAIARDVAHKFLRIGIRASVFDDTHLMAMSASLLGPSDLVVAFSHSGRTSGVIEAVQIARAAGASVVAVTTYPHSPLAEAADVVLCATARGSPLTGENAAARIAQLNVMDAVFVAVAQKDYERAERNLARTMGAVRSKRRD